MSFVRVGVDIEVVALRCRHQRHFLFAVFFRETKNTLPIGNLGNHIRILYNALHRLGEEENRGSRRWRGGTPLSAWRDSLLLNITSRMPPCENPSSNVYLVRLCARARRRTTPLADGYALQTHILVLGPCS